MAGPDGLRATAARDKDFTGIDTAAMAALIRQMTRASGTITGWLRANAALPAGVARTGLHQATAVADWVRAQPAMLTRRRDYAVAHLGGPAAGPPHVSAGRLGAAARHTTAAGAGHQVGDFPDARAALGAGTADAAAVRAAVAGHHAVPAAVWRRLEADAGDPGYARGLYERLGPAGTADLIAMAAGDDARTDAVRTSLGLASHHTAIDERWLRALLAEASRRGVRDDALRLLHHAGLDPRASAALDRLCPAPAPPSAAHRPPVPDPRPPHTTHDPGAARHPANDPGAGASDHPGPHGHSRQGPGSGHEAARGAPAGCGDAAEAGSGAPAVGARPEGRPE